MAVKGKKIEKAADAWGQELRSGDTVATLNGDMTAKIYDICKDMDVEFVYLRPLHQPHRRGVWHAADHVRLIGVRKN